ncbi:Precorrin-8X methylmutase [gamma proteobacterium HdN1]|nr:Precorrin-8X methylmutase [gamma proteobacterium HdN1]
MENTDLLETATPILAERRGACPSLSVPMPTGDGLLARLDFVEAGLSPWQFAQIARGAAKYGNGKLEITMRGKLQVRGLRPETKATFAQEIAAMRLPIQQGVEVRASPLAGVDATEAGDSRVLAAAIREGILARGLFGKLAPKLSVVVDGGGAFSLRGLDADVYVWALREGPSTEWGVALGCRGACTHLLGRGDAAQAVDAVLSALVVLAGEGRSARGWTLAAAQVGSLRTLLRSPPPDLPQVVSVASLRFVPPCNAETEGAEAVLGAQEVVPAFGQISATAAEAFARALPECASIRFSPNRGLLVSPLSEPQREALLDAAERLGLITDPSDPRLKISLCVGAPSCPSSYLHTYVLANRIATDWTDQNHQGGSEAILPLHLSGCEKLCGRPLDSRITLIGSAEGPYFEKSKGSERKNSLPSLNPQLEKIRQLAGLHSLNQPHMATQDTTYVEAGLAIYRESFAIIRAEADLSKFSAEEADVVVRMIHACGLVEMAKNFYFSEGFVAAARNALERGAPILCDANMVAWGITRKRLPAENPVICTLEEATVTPQAKTSGQTRSAAAVELWHRHLEGAVIAIGNAPTALFRLLDMLKDGAPKPAAIIGMPVGFVGALESKEALMESDVGVPWAVVRGRFGGSAVTAAAVNALARPGL